MGSRGQSPTAARLRVGGRPDTGRQPGTYRTPRGVRGATATSLGLWLPQRTRVDSDETVAHHYLPVLVTTGPFLAGNLADWGNLGGNRHRGPLGVDHTDHHTITLTHTPAHSHVARPVNTPGLRTLQGCYLYRVCTINNQTQDRSGERGATRPRAGLVARSAQSMKI